MGTILLIWTVHAVAGAILSAPILYFGRKRVGWANWELLCMIVPFCVWALLMWSPLSAGRKSLANIGEPIYISFAMPIAALVRVGAGKHVPERICAAGLIGALCLVAATVFFAVPCKPE